MNIILPGRPITKKNSMVKTQHGLIQSKQYRTYEEQCLYELLSYRGPKYAGPIRLTCLYWMPSRKSWPDLIGLLQASSDILQKAGIIDNDRNVISFDGSRIMGVDKLNPRCEIEIEEVDG